MDKASGEGGENDSGLRLRMKGEERRITSQHERLDDLCREVYAQLDKAGGKKAVDHFDRFFTALDAHMTVEEDIYFPALHGLRAEAGSTLSDFVVDHVDFRADAAEIYRLLESGHREGARLVLDRLARRVSAHELAEEDLIARITEGPASDSGYSNLD